jgi:PBP1b-binding outer membrane lipoprotein LpoB
MNKLFLLLPTLFLAGCASTPPQTIVKTEQVVFVPNRSLFTCPNVRRFPNPETLTDTQVAELLITLHRNNTNCQKNINTIWRTIDDAKKTTEGTKSD